MMKAATLGFWSAVLLTLTSVGGCQRGDSVNENLLQLDQGTFEVTGPYMHENMTVFLLHSNEQDDREFITLDQGLKDGVVKVSEQNQAQVNQLEINNESDQYLFLQEGDRVVGGQQDRIIITSLVIPPKSGNMPLPSFCVEAGRWQGQKHFGAGANSALAPKDVRQASKVVNQQPAVWEKVRDFKNTANMAQAVNAPNTNTSLNETLESPQVQKMSDECAKALENILDEHPRAVGVVVAINGAIEEINIYPNHKVLSSQYPRLLRSYALQAALEEKKADETAEMTIADVRTFMSEQKEQAEAQKREVNTDNYLYVCPSADKTECQTVYSGKVVHRQWLGNNEAMAKQAAPGPQSESRGQPAAPNAGPRDNVQRAEPRPQAPAPKQ